MRNLWLAVLTASSMRAQTSIPALPGAKDGTPLIVEAPQPVKDSVSVQAVLLPYTITSELFSKHIAQNYVVAVVNIGNRSKDAALVIEGLYLDYSHWALSGVVRRTKADEDKVPGNSATTLPSQVSSVEYRIVRGQLEERQPKSARNWVLRSLQLTGSVAAAFTFPLGDASSNIAKGIAAFNGVGIPGFEKLWPDSLITKLNRISDFGYRVNRIVPRESSDIVLAFYPIGRFLTPSLKKLYIAMPAVFFNPGLALIDPAVPKEYVDLLAKVSGKSLDELRGQVPHMLACKLAKDAGTTSSDCDSAKELMRMVAATTLNSISLVIDGSMVVDLRAVPAAIGFVTFGKTGDDPAKFWSIPGDKSVTLTGRFLSGGKLAIREAEALGIIVGAVDDKTANAESLTVALKFVKPIASGSTLTLKVVKETRDGRTAESLSFPVTMSYTAAMPMVSDAQATAAKVTITGKNLGDPSLKVILNRSQPVGGAWIVNNLTVNAEGSTFAIDIKKEKLGSGCYAGTITASDAAYPIPDFVIEPTPAISKATRTGSKVELEGMELFDMPKCGRAIVFKVFADHDGASSAMAVKNIIADSSGTKATFDFDGFPETDEAWNVEVFTDKRDPKPVFKLEKQ